MTQPTPSQTVAAGNCGGRDRGGANKITKVTREIWPLEIGKAVSYDYSGVDEDGNP